jgi:cyclic pyranopterin phosphate synthase
MPEGCEKVSMSQILTYEEIERICRAAAGLGISRIKITGGEPFVRRGCTDLIRRVKAIDGIEEVTVTTNGQTLDKYIDELKEIGIDGVNISLDSLDPDNYRYITGGGELAKTLNSIGLSAKSGIKTKVNCILQKGCNEDELFDLAGLAFTYGIDVRFIEEMTVGAGKLRAGISNDDVLKRLKERWPDLEPDESIHGNGPAVYYKRGGVPGAIGLISPIHGVFCAECNRIRLTSQGKIRPCLCYDREIDIVPALAGTDEDIAGVIRAAILAKPESHCFSDKGFEGAQNRLMSQIGG